MSDELNRSIKEVIMPTVYSDGRIIRLNQLATPTKDCLFEDAENNKKIFKVFNTIGTNGVLAAFNLDEKEETVTGTISPKNIIGLKKGTYLVYNWFTGENFLMDYDEEKEIALENYDDFRLLLFIPVKEGKAVIGLKEKYMSPATVKVSKDTVEAFDDGTLLIYADGAIKEISVKKGEKIKF